MSDVERARRRRTWCTAVSLAGLATVAHAEPSRVRVEMTAGGTCIVSGSGPALRGTMTYPRRTAEPRCAIAGVAPGSAIELEVIAPPGAPRPAAGFPRLEWTERDGRWVGRGSLPASPAFVRLDEAGTAAAARALDALTVAATIAAALWSLARGRAA